MLFERVDLRTPPDAFAPSVVNSELMHRAAREGHDLVLELLIEKCGGDVNAREEDGTSTVTVLMAAAARGRTACVARLVAAGAAVDATCDDYREKNGRVTSVTTTTYGGVTAAMLAATHGHPGCLNVLRAAGAEMERRRTPDGATAMALHRARVEEDLRRFKTLTERDASDALDRVVAAPSQ